MKASKQLQKYEKKLKTKIDCQAKDTGYFFLTNEKSELLVLEKVYKRFQRGFEKRDWRL